MEDRIIVPAVMFDASHSLDASRWQMALYQLALEFPVFCFNDL